MNIANEKFLTALLLEKISIIEQLNAVVDSQKKQIEEKDTIISSMKNLEITSDFPESE